MAGKRLRRGLTLVLAGWLFVVLTFGSTRHNHSPWTLFAGLQIQLAPSIVFLAKQAPEPSGQHSPCLACLIAQVCHATLVAPLQVIGAWSPGDVICLQRPMLLACSPTDNISIRAPPTA